VHIQAMLGISTDASSPNHSLTPSGRVVGISDIWAAGWCRDGGPVRLAGLRRLAQGRRFHSAPTCIVHRWRNPGGAPLKSILLLPAKAPHRRPSDRTPSGGHKAGDGSV